MPAKRKPAAEPEPQLVEVPQLTRLSREEIEARLTLIQAKRLTAAVVYHEGRNAKLKRQGDIIERRINQQLDMLEKDLQRAEALVEKIEKRAEQVEILRHNATLNADMIVVMDKDTENE